MMIVYEVSLEVQKSIKKEFMAWLQGHVKEIVALPGFLGARILESTDDDGHVLKLCVHYNLASQADLDTYFEIYAPKYRADGLERFPTQFTASRQVYRELELT